MTNDARVPPLQNERTRARLASLKARLAGRAVETPASVPPSSHANTTRRVVCDICRNRRSRAPDAEMDICVDCLRDSRIRAGIDTAQTSVSLPPGARRPSGKRRAAKKVSRLEGAERIAGALQGGRYKTRIAWDREHPEEAIFVHAERGTRPHEIGIVEIRIDGSIGFDRDFAAFYERGKGVAALVDKALEGLELDPALNPPPDIRMEISAREAAFDIARLAEDEALALGVRAARGYAAELASHALWDIERPRQVILRLRSDPDDEIGRVRVFDDGRITLSDDTEPSERPAIEALIARALHGRRVVPVEILKQREARSRG